MQGCSFRTDAAAKSYHRNTVLPFRDSRSQAAPVLTPDPYSTETVSLIFWNPCGAPLDYLDGRWRGTLENLEICGQLPELMPVEQITVGFLSHHRSGIIYPEYLELYTGPDAQHLAFTAKLEIPCRPCPREIARQDFSLPVRNHIGAFRFVAGDCRGGSSGCV